MELRESRNGVKARGRELPRGVWDRASATASDFAVPWTFGGIFSAFTYTKTIGTGDNAESIVGTVIVSADMTEVYLFIDG